MNRREWTQLAEIICSERKKWVTAGDGYELGRLALDLMAHRIAGVLASHHARFNVERFLAACGMSDCDARGAAK